VTVDDAAELIAPAVAPGGTWADLGAGSGTFTRALVRLLGPAARVHAVDRDGAAMAALRVPSVTTHVADFTGALDLPPLDGALLANALHFVPYAEQPRVLERVVGWLRPGGRLVVVEYANRAASRWVPYPVDLARLGATLPAGMTAPRPVGERRSAYGGTMYAAAATRAAGAA
jgi:trans-aconitate methyltransferase